MTKVALKEDVALIDKYTCSNIAVESVDEAKENLLMKDRLLTKKTVFDQKQDKEIQKRYLSINDTVGSTSYNLTNFYSNLDGQAKECVKIQTSIHGELANLEGQSVEQALERLDETKSSLQGYGVDVDLSEAEISEIEINRTFEIEDDIAEYERPLNLIVGLIPLWARMIYSNEDEKGNICQDTYYLTTKKSPSTNQYTILKIYGKSKQLKEVYGITTNQHFIRFEFTLHGKDRIKSALRLRNKSIYDLTDVAVNEFFNKKIYDLIVEPVKRWKGQQSKQLLKIMENYRNADGYKWVNRCLTNILNAEVTPKQGRRPLILDIEELIPLIDKLYPVGNKRKKTKAAFRRVAAADADTLTRRDDLRLYELIWKLTRGTQTQVELQEPQGFPKLAPLPERDGTAKKVV